MKSQLNERLAHHLEEELTDDLEDDLQHGRRSLATHRGCIPCPMGKTDDGDHPRKGDRA